MMKRWYVTCWQDVGGEDPSPNKAIWTVSLFPIEEGWNTDGGCLGYGLTKFLAQELADAANEAWERKQCPSGVRLNLVGETV